MFNSGFSLIELLVVVAIVGLLSGISVPVYRHYSIATKLQTVIPIINSIAALTQKYWATKSVFPANAYTLGLTSTVNSTVVSNPQTYNPSLASLSMGSQGTGSSAACNGSIYIAGSWNVAQMGLPEDITGATFTCYFFNRSGTILSNCSYMLSKASGGYDTGDYIPSWYGCKESTCTNPLHYYQQKDGYGSKPGFTASNCL